MTIDSSNMSNAEYYKLNGTLSPERIERLLELECKTSISNGVSPYIDEAMHQFPAENFLSDVISTLQELSKKVRGENRDTIINLIETIDDIQQTTLYSTEYGLSELKKALDEINLS